VVFFVFLRALGGFVVNGAQKPGAVIDFVWMSVAYFLASGAISDALAISVNTRFSSGKCCLITRRASASVTASTRGVEFVRPAAVQSIQFQLRQQPRQLGNWGELGSA